MIATYAEPLENHETVLVYPDPDQIAPPFEVCATCSDDDQDLWVRVTACAPAAANQLPEGSVSTNVITLSPKCTSCGRRDQMERWQDPRGSGWQCHATDCFQMTVDGEDE